MQFISCRSLMISSTVSAISAGVRGLPFALAFMGSSRHLGCTACHADRVALRGTRRIFADARIAPQAIIHMTTGLWLAITHWQNRNPSLRATDTTSTGIKALHNPWSSTPSLPILSCMPAYCGAVGTKCENCPDWDRYRWMENSML